MASQLLIAELDDGPTKCVLGSVWEQITDKNNISSKILNFCYNDTAKAKIENLESLLRSYNNLLHDRKAILIRKSIVEWIFYTNKIEFCSLPTPSDTEEFIFSGRTIDEPGAKETQNTFTLLKNAYKENESSTYNCIFDENSLKEHHRILTFDILRNAGKFRTTGAETININGTKHKFPHHQTVTSFLRILGHLTAKLAEEIDKMTDRKVLYVFALSAFVQFHFVEIHPFEDGNGRMCRFLCKRILDSVLPFPFPMFKDRNKYLSSIESGRDQSQSVFFAPQQLFNLLLNEAIEHFETLLNGISQREFDRLIYTDDWKVVEEDLKKRGIDYEKSSPDLKNTFESLEDNQFVDFLWDSYVIRVQRPIYSLDDL